MLAKEREERREVEYATVEHVVWIHPIGIRLGFRAQSYFARDFRAISGALPSATLLKQYA